jgi:phage major head subunit gpT-like protein
MQITPVNLKAVANGLNTALMQGVNSFAPKSKYQQIAMEISSTHALENYAFMKSFPVMREWVGHRVIQNLEMTAYQIQNKPFESTLGVKRTDIEDDSLNFYTNTFQQLGEAAAMHPDLLVWQQLQAGFDGSKGVASDGQYFFDSDHVGYDANGNETSYSNVQSGSSAAWYLMDLSRGYLKPLIFQRRTALEFVQLTKPEDDNVFMSDEYLYGVRTRYGVGYGFHQLAFGSKATLDSTNYAAARQAMMGQYRPDGTPMGIMPNTLIYGRSNELAVINLIKNQRLANGQDNPWYQSVNTLLVEWLP